jgi:hypothetical protein
MEASATKRWPRLEGLRLLSDGRSAALVGPEAELHWWCWPRFDSLPLCWSLLDPRGGHARWLEASHAGSDGEPAGPTTRTLLRIGFTARVEVWDGLVVTDEGGTDLVRLVRALDDAVDVWHSVKLGGFDAPWGDWAGSRAELEGLPPVAVLGGSTTYGSDGTALTRLRAEPSTWTGLVIGGPRVDVPDLAELEARLRDSEEERDRTAPRRVSRTHAERIRHSLTLLTACTDRTTGAVVASPVTSLPEVVGGDRQFDYRYSWLRDSSVAITSAALVGNHELAARYVRFLVSLGADRILEAPLRTGSATTRRRSCSTTCSGSSSTPCSPTAVRPADSRATCEPSSIASQSAPPNRASRRTASGRCVSRPTSCRATSAAGWPSTGRCSSPRPSGTSLLAAAGAERATWPGRRSSRRCDPTARWRRRTAARASTHRP